MDFSQRFRAATLNIGAGGLDKAEGSVRAGASYQSSTQPRLVVNGRMRDWRFGVFGR